MEKAPPPHTSLSISSSLSSSSSAFSSLKHREDQENNHPQQQPIQPIQLDEDIENNSSPVPIVHHIRHLPLKTRLWEVTIEYFPLIFITFGGPAAHIGILHQTFVVKKKWLSDRVFTELLGISSALPGPASTQLAFAVALIRGGIIPAIWAFLIWSVPGATIMTVLGSVIANLNEQYLPEWVYYIETGLASVAVGLVAIASYNLSNKICIDRITKFITSIAAVLTINFSDIIWLIPCLMIIGGLFTLSLSYSKQCNYNVIEKYFFKFRRKSNVDLSVVSELNPIPKNQQHLTTDIPSESISTTPLQTQPKPISTPKTEEKPPIQNGIELITLGYSKRSGFFIFILWLILFILSILFRWITSSIWLQLLGTFYFVGSIIFGGGPVVIPLLYGYLVTSDWLSSTNFLLGLAIINALPGPNFNFAAYCGAAILRPYGILSSILGGLLSYSCIFIPGLFIKYSSLPFWIHYRHTLISQHLFRGMNASAIGFVFTATFLLFQKALTYPHGISTSLSESNLYSSLIGITFVFVLFFNLPAPIMIVVGGIIGCIHWLIIR